MFLRRLLPTASLAGACLAPAHAVEPALLDAQLKRLAALLGDSYATAYPERAQVQTFSRPAGQNLSLALFTIEAYGGGNNHRQYLAVFEEDVDETGRRGHFMLRGVTQVGAKGWRAVPVMQAEARFDEASGTAHFVVPALVNAPGDAANFPSKKVDIRLVLDRSGLSEVQSRVAP
ncbi:MAG: hypothetical protein EOP92_25500 [Lysobacteraceae bacterium]|nr:MAG: hypothetical protein EOP92_25500 [Xanthomonadaceae bacterium]